MLRIKHLSNTTLQITFGLFFSVIIYYLNNFFYVLGSTEKIGVQLAVFIPLIILSFVNFLTRLVNTGILDAPPTRTTFVNLFFFTLSTVRNFLIIDAS